MIDTEYSCMKLSSKILNKTVLYPPIRSFTLIYSKLLFLLSTPVNNESTFHLIQDLFRIYFTSGINRHVVFCVQILLPSIMLFKLIHVEPCTGFCFFWLLNNIPDIWFLTRTKWTFPVNDTASGFYLQESFSTTSKSIQDCLLL